MYPQYGEHRFPPGQDFGGAGQARVPVDHARYPYHGYYSMKGSEGSQYGGMAAAAAAAQRGAMGSPYAKRMATPEGMYSPGWSSNSMNYMGPQGKSLGGSYAMQVCGKALLEGFLEASVLYLL